MINIDHKSLHIIIGPYLRSYIFLISGNSVASLPTGTSIEPRICVPALPTPPPQKKIKISCQNTPSTPKEWLKKGPSNETIKISNMAESPILKPPKGQLISKANILVLI